MTLTRRLKFTIPRLVMCRILCEGLESIDGIVDAVQCFHRMKSEWTVAQDEELEWVLGTQFDIVLVVFLNIFP